MSDALIIVDVQNDFLETGALPVKDGSQVVAVINKLVPGFENIVVTQDWHPEDHISFARSHVGKAPYDVVDVCYGKQVLWPVHCVAGTSGAELAPGLTVPERAHFVRKGVRKDMDCYSAVKDAEGTAHSDIIEWLRSRSVDRVFVCGLATDFCVSMTALDLKAEGFDTVVIEDATRAVDFAGSLEKAHEDWSKAGIRSVGSCSLA